MKNILVVALVFVGLSSAAQAQDKSLRGILGFSSGAVNLGADFEMKQTNTLGYGGYFFFGSDEDNNAAATRPEVLALGGLASIHLLNDNNVDVYVAPGFGLAKIEYPAGDDEMTFGPTVKLGAEFKVAPTVKVGLQHFIITNWLSDEVGSEISYTNAAATFAF